MLITITKPTSKEVGLYCVCTNIEEFQYYQRNGETMLLIKVLLGNNKGFWTFIFPGYYSFILNSKLNKERYDALDKIYFTNESSKAIVLEEFSYLSYMDYMALIDSKIYFISASFYPDKGTNISEFEAVEPTPLLGNYFIVKDKNGETLFNSNPNAVLGPCTSIQRIDEVAYPRYNQHFDAYFAKDESGNIVGMCIGSDYDMFSHIFFYEFRFTSPALEVKFLMRTAISQPEDVDFPDYMVEIWGLTFETKKWLLIQQLGSKEKLNLGYLMLDYSKLIF